MSEQQEFAIQRIYIKDISFESPNTPQIFKQDWRPDVSMDISSKSEKLADDVYHVTLPVTATVKRDETTIFICEIQQAGIFTLKGFSDTQLGQMLGSFCPNILFPYIREAVSDVAVRGGFPPLYLAPINFDAFYAEQLKRRQQAATDAE